MSSYALFRQYQDHIVDELTQKRLGQPLTREAGLDKEHESFLTLLTGKLDAATLDPMKPETLFNHADYDALREEKREATDLTALNLMGVIRQIKTIWTQNHQPSFQMQNLVDTVFQMKSKFEQKHGDVFII